MSSQDVESSVYFHQDLTPKVVEFEESLRPLTAQLTSVGGGGEQVKLLDPTDSCCPFEEPRFWFQSPGLTGPPSWVSPRTVGIGILNTGNSCFMNAAIQALCYCPPLAQDSLRGMHSKSCARTAAGVDCVACRFERVLVQLLQSEGKSQDRRRDFVVLPRMLKELLGNGEKWGGFAADFMQQDTHEALTQLLDNLRRCDLPMSMERDFETHKIANSELSTCYWNQLTLGFLEETRTCVVCGKSNRSFQPFWDLLLSIGNISTFEGALDKYFDAEYLGIGNEVWCDACGQKQPKIVRRRIYRPPNVLTVVFQRVNHGERGVKKMEQNIGIPVELDLAKHISADSRQPVNGSPPTFASDDLSTPPRGPSWNFDRPYKTALEKSRQLKPAAQITFSKESAETDRYDFFSAIAHSGCAVFGHYYAYCRAPNNFVYSFNDERVRMSSIVQGDLLHFPSSTVYVCMYVRRHPVRQPDPSTVARYRDMVSINTRSKSSTGGLTIAEALKVASSLGSAQSTSTGLSARVVVVNNNNASAPAETGESAAKVGVVKMLSEESTSSGGGSPSLVSSVSSASSPVLSFPPDPSSVDADCAVDKLTPPGLPSLLPQSVDCPLPVDDDDVASKSGNTLEVAERSENRNAKRRCVAEMLEGMKDRNPSCLDLEGSGEQTPLPLRKHSAEMANAVSPSLKKTASSRRKRSLSQDQFEQTQQISKIEDDVSPTLAPAAKRQRHAVPIQGSMRNSQSVSLMSQFGVSQVGDWESGDDEDLLQSSSASHPRHIRAPPSRKRRSMEFTSCQGALQMKSERRSEHDREYDQGKTKKIKVKDDDTKEGNSPQSLEGNPFDLLRKQEFAKRSPSFRSRKKRRGLQVAAYWRANGSPSVPVV